MGLETEIATALTSREIASAQLAALIERVIAVTAAADEEVTKQRQKLSIRRPRLTSTRSRPRSRPPSCGGTVSKPRCRACMSVF